MANTTNLDLAKPAGGAASWGATLNANFDRIDAAGAINVLAFTTAAIQAAIDALPATGGKIYFRSGPYTKTGAAFDLSGKYDVTFFGDGWDSCIDNSGNDNRVFNAADTARIRFSGLRIKGSFDSATGAAKPSCGLVVSDNLAGTMTVDLTVDHCYFDNLNGDAIRIGTHSERVKILNNTMVGGLGFCEIVGVTADRLTKDIQIIGNHITASVSSTRDPVGATNITGSDDLIDCYGGTSNLVIALNTFDGASAVTDDTSFRTGILLLPANGYGTIRNVSITGNTFRRFQNDGSYTDIDACIRLDGTYDNDGLEDIEIVGNTIYDSIKGIMCNSITGNDAIAITGNVFTDCTVGIWFYADNGNIVGNTIIRPVAYGIYKQGDNTQIIANKFTGATTAGAEAIRSTSGNDTTISNNHITGGVAGSYSVHVIGTRCKVTENTIVNQPGTAIRVHASAVSTQVYGNKFNNNGANLSNAGTTTMFSPALEVIATASLPAANAALDGMTIIEDAGVGDVNLIVYGRGERHRFDGGANV